MFARFVLLSTFLLSLVGAAAAQPITRPPMPAQPEQAAAPAAQQQPTGQALSAAAEQLLRQHPDAVRERAQQIADQRAQRLSWITGRPRDIRWFGVPRLYFGNAWLLKDACEGERCLPKSQVRYGIEGFLSPVGFADLFGRIGGATSFYDNGPTQTGMDARVGVRLHLLGIVAASVAYAVQTASYDFAAEGEVKHKTTAHHGLAFGAEGTLRGATVTVAADLLWANSIDALGQGWLGFQPMGVVSLLTPPMWGF